jgi:hypothetical protein
MLSAKKTKLVRLAAALALLGTASFGAMAEWTQVAESSSFKSYVDLSTIRRSGNMVKMWSLYDEKSPRAMNSGTYLSLRSRDEYDCSEERVRGLDMSTHSERMGGGATLMTDSTLGQWKSIAPGSYGDAFLKAACNIK